MKQNRQFTPQPDTQSTNIITRCMAQHQRVRLQPQSAKELRCSYTVMVLLFLELVR